MANRGCYSIGIYIYGHIPLAVVTVERIVNGLQVLVVSTLDLYPIWPTVAVTLYIGTYGHTLFAVVTVERNVNGLQVLVVNTLDLYLIWPTVAVTL